MLGTLSMLCATLCTGCSDRLTGPEAVKLVDALESARATDPDDRRIWWDRLFGFDWHNDLARLHDVSSVELLRGGRNVPYRALIIESLRTDVAAGELTESPGQAVTPPCL